MENNYIHPFLKSIGESLHQFSRYLMGHPEKEVDRYQSRWGEIDDGFLSSNNDGYTIGQYRISESVSLRSVLALAPSGVGKTSSIVINCALSAIGQSFIIHSEADDVFQKTSGYFKKQGYKIYKLDVSNPKESHTFNPLANITQHDVGKLAQLIIGSSNKTDPFWSDSAQSLLIVIFLLQLKMPQEFRTLSYTKKVLTWLGGEPQKVDELMAKYSDDETMEKYKYLISMSDGGKTFISILATCQASMRIFDDPNVAEVTSSNEIPLNIRSERTVVYLKNSLHNSTYVSMILGIFLHQVTKELMKQEPKKNERPVYAILDESSLLYRAIPDLGMYLTQGRKYKLSYLLVAQNVDLLKKFKDFEAILANSYTKLYFNSLDVSTSEYVSNALGRTTIIDSKGQEKVVPLITPEQVRQMVHNQVIILSGNRNAYKVILQPYYQQFILNMRSKLPSVNILQERKKLLN